MNKTSTSAQTAEVTDKTKPAAKQTREEKIIAGLKEAWGKLQSSDKQWEKTGRAFGKWCSELRKLTKKQGSRKGLGFEATVKKHGVNFQKARYWADVVDGKIKPRYAGGSTVAPKTNDKPKADAPKPIPVCLMGVSEAEQGEIIKAAAVIGRVTFSRFIQHAAVEPSNKEVRWLVNHCLSKLDKLQEQLDLLADLRGWIDHQCFELQDQIEAGITMAQRPTPRLSVAFMDENEEVNTVSALINKARESGVSADANTNTPEPTVPAELVVPQQEAAAAAGVM